MKSLTVKFLTVKSLTVESVRSVRSGRFGFGMSVKAWDARASKNTLVRFLNKYVWDEVFV